MRNIKNYSDNFIKYYHDSKIEDYKDDLRKKGFEIRESERHFDLMAEKDGKTIAYEFKVVRYGNRQMESILKQKEYALKLGYDFKMVYLNPPKRMIIEIDWLEEELQEKLNEYFEDNNIDELDILSTHTRFSNFNFYSVDYIKLTSDEIIFNEIDGEIEVILQNGSDKEAMEEDISTMSFPITIDCKFDYDKELIADSIKYYIDTNEFYADSICQEEYEEEDEDEEER